MRALWIAAGLVVVLLMSGLGWTEGRTRREIIIEGIQHRRQLQRLIGMWKFHVDMSPTFHGYPDVGFDFQFTIHKVSQGYIGEDLDDAAYAAGSDRGDNSLFRVRVRPQVIAGQTYSFSMYDVYYDGESGDQLCFDYMFSQVGGYIFGYAKVARKSKEGYCNDVVGVGIVTGIREEEKTKK